MCVVICCVQRLLHGVHLGPPLEQPLDAAQAARLAGRMERRLAEPVH